MTDKKIIELLKSGNFTLHYHDNGACDLYKGIHKEILPNKEIASFSLGFNNEGYLPKEVELLVKALGGESGTE